MLVEVNEGMTMEQVYYSKTVVELRTEEEAKRVLDMLESIGAVWRGGAKYNSEEHLHWFDGLLPQCIYPQYGTRGTRQAMLYSYSGVTVIKSEDIECAR